MSPAAVLLVDDDASIRRMLTRTLAAEGYAVAAVADGGAALAAVERSVPDALVLDVAMPGMDGLAVTRRLRGKGLALPILLLTARDGLGERVAGLDAGADDYLVKPFESDELAARLRALLRRMAGHAQEVWSHGALSYEPATRRVQWRGAPVKLTGRELALLEALLRNPQRVLSKTQLRDALYDWGEAGPESNALEVHVHNLRRKIDAGVVRTVHGVGYALGAAENLA